ncbi:MAE_28990/MAE_18760 family HEPN-like nuclease [Bradyrhizobium sp. Ai1a-2]|uniref:MAE_28990/MAE_18760 family HEPN-like nuclease n=1 Tax=Bradyrhizobium sp. Ai1a-2 TaxID=196490 RepID=UPI0004878F18|nr:MAE_28990/MAE_18760 family HEPN-like nuclease [Bradyrhizobium sp. Ai1a-2]
MTYTFLRDFEDRKRQVRHYLAVVTRQERSAGIGASRVEEGRLLTLRAGTFLVLYNLIEASTRGAIEAIHDQITTNEAPFTLLSTSLRKEVVRLFKKAADPSTNHTVDDFPSAFVAIALAQGMELSGNVDARVIRKIGATYGFSHTTRSPLTRDGNDLLTIKTNRNDLAHGRKTFEEIGRDHTTRELLLLARRSMRYMDDILANVAHYLDKEHYLEFPPKELGVLPLSSLART